MMSENSSDNVRPRPVIVDIVQSSNTEQKKRKRNNRNKRKQPESRIEQFDDVAEFTDNRYAIEMQPVIRAMREYARKTYAIGVLESMSSLHRLNQVIRELNVEEVTGPISARITQELESLRCKATKARSED